MNALFERWRVHMPKYYNVENFGNRGKITIIPVPWYRNIPILKSWLPYHVGDRVKFRLLMEKEPSEKSTRIDQYIVSKKDHYIIVEQLGDKIIPMDDIKTGNIFTGTKISIEQSIAYFIGRSNMGFTLEKEMIFSTTVQSWDTVRTNLFWILLAAILGGVISLAIGIILGLIQFTPALFATW